MRVHDFAHNWRTLELMTSRGRLLQRRLSATGNTPLADDGKPCIRRITSLYRYSYQYGGDRGDSGDWIQRRADDVVKKIPLGATQASVYSVISVNTVAPKASRNCTNNCRPLTPSTPAVAAVRRVQS